jgi:PEP-CTERM motif-containing protein
LPGIAAPGYGCIDTGAGTNVVTSGGTLSPGLTGQIKNLTFGGGAVAAFLVIPSAVGFDFTLTGLGPGSSNTACGGLSLGQSCSIAAGSPFVLTSLGSNTVLSFGAFGTVADSTGTSTWSGLFTSQFNMSAATIQTTLLGDGSITSTYSGQFSVTSDTSSVPEPAILSLLGLGLVGLGVLRRKKAV